MDIIKSIPQTFIAVLVMCSVVTESFSQNSAEVKKTNDYYNSIVKSKDVAKLNFFFSQMPKGGDIHHHYSGAQYVETYLDWAKAKKYKINSNTLKVDTISKDASVVTVDALRANSALYRSLISKWSDQDFYNHTSLQIPPDQHFFNTFSYFSSLCKGNDASGFQVLKKRALIENVQYIETMYSLVGLKADLTKFDSQLLKCQESKSESDLNNVFNTMLKGIDEKTADKAVKSFNEGLEKAKVGIDDDNFTMRYQTYASRNDAASKVFVSLYAAFRACADNKDIVGVNLVGPENGVVAMRDYWLHMQMFKFFKSQERFKNLNVALHAGELAMGMVRPEELSYHIDEAINIAGASRIGHGIDIPFEKNASELIKDMAKTKKVVEINLTSNEFILGIKGNQHPIRLYYDAGVPVVISTDDAGVSRNNLTNEYMLLASRYEFTYDEIKKIVANSIQYSFLPKELKDKQMLLLEKQFGIFEKKISSFVP